MEPGENPKPSMNELELTGRARTHVKQMNDPRFAMHPEALEAFLEMKEAANKDGIRMNVFSSFRDFKAQSRIWNLKCQGKRPLYDRAGRPLHHSALNGKELVETILIWSALPGASRHHWGTDVDLVGRVPQGYQVELLPHEYEENGIFGELNRWMSENLHRFGFFRPYREDLGGVSVEPWHVSYAPLSIPALEQLTPQLLRKTLKDSNLEMLDLVLKLLEEIHSRFVANVNPPRSRL